MKTIFVHSHVFLKKQGQYYTSGSLTADVMRRYINIFGNITLVTRGRDVSEVKEGLEPSSIENTSFVRVPNYKSISKLHSFFSAKKIIENQVKEADFIIARTSSLANIAIKYAKKYNKPYLVEVVGCSWDASWNYNLIGKLIAPYNYFKQKKVVKEAPYAVYVTNEFLQRRYPTNGKSTNCSNVTLQEFDDVVLEKRLNKIKSLTKESKIIIGTTAAVNVKYKGQQRVIKALGELKKKGIKNFEYQLVGGGDQNFLKSIAEKYEVSDYIKFLGPLPHNKVFEWLETIDIYAQPSMQEGLPRALIEAMSRGIPAIGADTAGIPELLENKYIFSNNRNNFLEITNILLGLGPEEMFEQAKRNFKESIKYDKNVIETRRYDFFQEFINNSKIH
ncbi:glycosyltransferase family 4 protein [Oceanobacillus halophilus]|uniref:Glycosyltransferase n=1 Tax=Oceanobacillus halophilus TaxID=930130 RepID=A0A495A3V8_9BACI|nr:glycosyltransferase [Oceanobacillus halophilus]RKQ34280.1 glycosyltransferase [Oceanobacillus halophilus]